MTRMGGRAVKVMDMADAPHLPGAHNWQNAALAYGAVQALCQRHQARSPPPSPAFPAWRIAWKMSAISARSRFINDSKATNADATARALAVYPDIFWIAGGKPKEGGIESLAAFFPRIRKAYLIGEAAPQFARTLDGKAPYEMSGTLEAAVASAAADAAASRRRRRWCCCRRPAPPTTSSRISSSAAMPSAALVAQAAARPEGGVMINRADKSGFANWWFTVDRVALLCMLALAGIGLMLAFAASPAITGGPLTAGDFRYAARQVAVRRDRRRHPVRRVAARSCARSASWRR